MKGFSRDHPGQNLRVPMHAMSKKPVKTLTKPTHNLLKGAIAGLIGGLAATAAKTLAERIYPPRTHGEPEPLAIAAEKLGEPIVETPEKRAVEEGIHWGFGALTGAAYGVMAELYPQVTAKGGSTFGLALMTVTHQGALPALGLSALPEEQQGRERRSETATHIVYGIVCETVRSVVRKII
jgi:putative membrane protein